MINVAQESELKVLINSVLEEKVESVTLPYMVPIRDFERVLKSLGFKELELTGDEINGWQIDFFYYFKHPKKGKYLLHGSLHYGDFKFTKADEEDDK